MVFNLILVSLNVSLEIYAILFILWIFYSASFLYVFVKCVKMGVALDWRYKYSYVRNFKDKLMCQQPENIIDKTYEIWRTRNHQ